MEVLLRNYITSCITQADQGKDRTTLFEWFCDSWKSPEKKQALILEQEKKGNPPYDKIRYEFVLKQARQLSQNVSEITKKTRFCTKDKCTNEKCSFAHSKDEWNPPYCLYQEFCKMPDCTKNHGFTKEEYIHLHDIKTEKTEKKLVNTQFCHVMREEVPCNIVGCKFCHSLWDYIPIKCSFYENCNNPQCVKKHDWDNIFSYMEKQGVKFNLWYLRSTEQNNSIGSKHLSDQSTLQAILWTESYTEKIKMLEQNGWKEEDVSSLFEKMSIDMQDDMDVEVDITICGKKSISLAEISRQQYLDEMKGENEDSEDDSYDSLLPEEEEEMMMVAAELGLDFETVYDLVLDGKQNLIFKWRQNLQKCI